MVMNGVIQQEPSDQHNTPRGNEEEKTRKEKGAEEAKDLTICTKVSAFAERKNGSTLNRDCIETAPSSTPHASVTSPGCGDQHTFPTSFTPIRLQSLPGSKAG
ncbi:hypothetical protein UY3_19147 [Chelonia mydas]|uniref:Uncharacterized protein n=1 Tax=Chelonia mydas TaxID=8469 RepID=M7ALX6_CHEMY|nr:hypothetical protein UY3_19147 [Chelonia mydas]